MDVSLSLPKEMHSHLIFLSKENQRTLPQEILYRLSQGLRMQRHLSESDTSLIKLIAEMYERRRKGLNFDDLKEDKD